MNSDIDKLYMQLLNLDQMYNFVVQIFFIWNNLHADLKLSSISGLKLTLIVW
jgi:hypothetical protein